MKQLKPFDYIIIAAVIAVIAIGIACICRQK